MKRQRNDDGDDGKDVEVLREWRLALRRRDQSGFEPEVVGEHERHHPEDGVGDEVKRDQQPIVPPYHRCAGGADMVSSMTSQISFTNRSRLKRSACCRMA